MRNGALGGQGMASVYGRAAWYQTSDWSMLFVPLALPEETDAFAIQASFHLPPVVDSGRAVSLVVFTSPGTEDPADLVHGRGITLDQQPGRLPVYFYGVPEGWTTADVTSTGPMAAPITGRWRTLRIEGSRAQRWLRVLLDGEEIHTGTGPCDSRGGQVMLGSLHGGGRPVNGAWTDLRVFRGAAVASMARRSSGPRRAARTPPRHGSSPRRARQLALRPGHPVGLERSRDRHRGRQRRHPRDPEGRGDPHRSM